jgi:hypothetical protein
VDHPLFSTILNDIFTLTLRNSHYMSTEIAKQPIYKVEWLPEGTDSIIIGFANDETSARKAIRIKEALGDQIWHVTVDKDNELNTFEGEKVELDGGGWATKNCKLRGR